MGKVTGQYQYNVICPVCGFQYKNYELKKRWDGLWVCKDDWETRNILDLYKNRNDFHPLPFTYPEDTSLTVGTINPSTLTPPFPVDTPPATTAGTGIVGLGIVGIMIVGASL